MTAIEVVVRPRPQTAPNEALAPLHGLCDVIVDGINLTARLGEGSALALLADLGQALAALNRGKRERGTLQLYAEDEVWEIGLEADGSDVLLTVFRSGPCPRVAVHERRIDLAALTRAVISALDEAPAAAPAGVVAALRSARAALSSPWPTYAGPRALRAEVEVAGRAVAGLAFSTRTALRVKRPRTEARGQPELERADLHSLLARGTFSVVARGRTLVLADICPFLVAERLVALAEDVFDAWRSERAVFRRVEIDGAQLSVRRGPGDVPLLFSIAGRGVSADTEGTALPDVEPKAFALAASRFARALANAFFSNDPSQRHNLRLTALERAAATLEDAISDTLAEDSLTNPEPESYRCFGLPRRHESRGPWSHGASMRFVPRWVATVPNIDLRATFQCGERIIVGSAREIACLDRNNGRMLWRSAAGRAAAVVTPLGLARLFPDGKIELCDYETGALRFSIHVTPRASGGATGALVNAPGLPKLLVVAEGDRSVSAVDLVSGDIRWRFTGRRPGNYRMRRAGKLLLVAGGDSALLALDVTSGEVVWRVRDRLPFSGDLSIDRDSAFALAGGPIGPSRLYHVDLWSGSVRWTRELDERPAPSQAPLITPDVVAVATRDRRGMGLSAFSRTSGEPIWEHVPGLASPTTAWLAVDDALIANSASGALFCLEGASGTVRYNHVFSRHVDADQPRRLEPVLRNGALFVPQHEVHVVRPRDGDVIGTVPTDLIPDLLRVDERCNVYVAEESGHLAAFGVAPKLTLVK